MTVFGRRRARVYVATVTALSLATLGAVASVTPAVATVSSDRAQIAQLEQKIADQGQRTEALVAKSNAVQGQIIRLDVQIAHDRARLVVDRRVEAGATAEARRVAVDAYMGAGGMGTSSLDVLSNSTSVTRAAEQNTYLSAANNKLNDELNTLVIDKARTQATERTLRSAHARATATLHALATAQRAATAAITSDEALLLRVKGNLRSLLKAEAERADAAQQAAERALARRPVSSQPLPPVAPPSQPSPLPPPPPPGPAPGGYANPLRAITALSPERIDQGVDYSGFGPIYAIGDGVVLSTVNGGWPGGTFIAYRLTSGPANGLVVFAAEDIQPSVQIGQSVNSNTVLGQVYAGPTGIETGWANPSGNGDTMARTYGQYHGGNSTAFGYNFSRLLQSLGAPGGVLQNNPPTGSVPSGWPQW